MSSVLHVQDLRVTLPTPEGRVQPVRGIDFTLMRGQVLGIVGESGCGKSMAALALMGLLPESAEASGSIRLLDQELVGADEVRMNDLRGNRIAMVFQEPMTALNPLHTIGTQIAEPLRLHEGLSKADARVRALELLERVAMPQAAQRLDAYPHQLSGGQRQRVGIAMALACTPDVLVADEPTTALDVTVQAQILALIERLVRESGMAMVLISHDLRLISRHVDAVAVMYAGQFVEQAATEVLFGQPLHPYTRGLIAARPSLSGPRGLALPTIPGTVPALHQISPACAFAPRCALAQERCTTSRIALQSVEAQQVRCVRATEWG